MDYETSSSAKMRITASLDAELIKAIDEFLEKDKTRSRSQLIEEALRNWYKQKKKRELERQIEEYYLSMSHEERKQDKEWNEIAAQSARHFWEK